MSTGTAGNSPWLHAWYDPVAGIKTFSQCMRLTDISADGDYRLLVADMSKKMRVYKGTGVSSMHTLLDIPVAVSTFYSDLAFPRTPSVAVAAGPYVFIYRNLRPYLKFTVPQVAISNEEVAVWDVLKGDAIDIEEACKRLANIRESGKRLSSRAADLLGLADKEAKTSYYATIRERPLVQQTVVTCMECINREREGDKELSSLIIGTEEGQILVLDNTGSIIEHTINLPSIPTHIAVSGLLNVDYRINVACRDGVIYAIKAGQLRSTKIELGILVSAMVRTDNYLVVATTQGRLQSYNPNNGKIEWSAQVPSRVSSICSMQMANSTATTSSALSSSSDIIAVGLEGGEIRVYNSRNHVASLNAKDTVTALVFGQYGRESNTLCYATRFGALAFKMLKRTAKLDVINNKLNNMDEDPPLPIPKKTRLYLDQTEREKEQGIEIHKIFQRDLCKLRLATTRAFVQAITEGGNGALASLSVSGTSLRLSANVMGLGPKFKIYIEITNVGTQTAHDVSIIFHYNQNIYNMGRPVISIPILVPGYRHTEEKEIYCIDPVGTADSVRCTVIKGNSPSPAISALISMPQSQV